MKIPHARRVAFGCLEALVLALPATIVVYAVGGLGGGAVADAIARSLIKPFFFGVSGMVIWISIYMTEETFYCRVGLFSLLTVFLVLWALFPSIFS